MYLSPAVLFPVMAAILEHGQPSTCRRPGRQEGHRLPRRCQSGPLRAYPARGTGAYGAPRCRRAVRIRHGTTGAAPKYRRTIPPLLRAGTNNVAAIARIRRAAELLEGERDDASGHVMPSWLIKVTPLLTAGAARSAQHHRLRSTALDAVLLPPSLYGLAVAGSGLPEAIEAPVLQTAGVGDKWLRVRTIREQKKYSR